MTLLSHYYWTLLIIIIARSDGLLNDFIAMVNRHMLFSLIGTVVLEPTNYVNSGCEGDNLTFFCNVSGTSLWWLSTRPGDDKLFTDIDVLQVPSQLGNGTITLLAIGTTYLYSSLHFTLNSRHNGTRIGCGPGLDMLVNRLVVVEGKE